MFVTLGVWFRKLFLLPHFIWIVLFDFVRWLKDKGWLRFEGWGLHIYVGRFGAVKTSSMVYDAYMLARRYPQLHILTNFQLYNFPKHTEILELKTVQDILHAPENTLVLIDEIGTIFNSRDFSGGKNSMPKFLFQYLCQCRKRHIQVFSTAQRWNFVDKQLRDIADTVRVTSCVFSHPFSRLATVYHYDAREYDLVYSNPLLPLSKLWGDVYIQSDFVRSLYDTVELVDNMLSAEYVSEAEVMQSRGYDLSMVDLDKKARKNLIRNKRSMI